MNVDSEVLYIALLFIPLTMNPHNKKQKENLYIITSIFSLWMAASLSFALIKRKIFPTSDIVRNIFSIKAAPLNIYSHITMLDKLT